ncbi:MAG: CHAT domain-containing protein [Nocardioidaceae bacterium]
MQTAEELYARAAEQASSGRHQQARQLLLRALDQPSTPDLQARIKISLAYQEAEHRSVDAGMTLLDEVSRTTGLGRQTRALVASQRALLWMRAGESRAAITEFDAALSALDESDPLSLARVSLNRGNVHLLTGSLAEARADFAWCAEVSGRHGLDVQYAKACQNIAYVDLLEGDLPLALQRMDQIRPAYEPLAPALGVSCDVDRAEVLAAAGLVTEASVVLRAAALTFGALRLRQSQAEAELALGRLLLFSRDPAGARQAARRARDRFRRRGSAGWALQADIVVLAADAQAGRVGVGDRAVALAAEFRARGLRGPARDAVLHGARGMVRRGDVDRARRLLAGVRLPEDAPVGVRLLNHAVRAEMAAQVGRSGAALRHVRSGLEDLHAWQSSFGSLDLQTSVVGHGVDMALQGIGLAIATGRPDVVFEWSERARALASRVQPVRPPTDERAQAALAELRQLQRTEAEQESEGVRDPAIERRLAQLRRRVRSHAWYPPGPGVVLDPVPLVDVLAVLRDTGGTLVTYVFAGGDIHALVADGAAPTLRRVCALAGVERVRAGLQADIDLSSAQIPAALRQAVRAGLDDRLRRLETLLWSPIADASGEGPVVIVPSGALAGVPWSLLPPLRSRPLTVARSASSWLLTRPETVPQSAGFVAGPDVPRAGEEVHLAAKAWMRATTLERESATAAAVRDLAAEVAVLHVAAHGRHSSDNPLFSGLELADGPWFGYDIDTLASVPSHVLLSACELGRSAVRWGEETLGMTQAWLHAGAVSVVASPGRVGDDAACEVLARTHEGLAAGRTPSVALVDAVTASDPEHVVPFMCFGSGW